MIGRLIRRPSVGFDCLIGRATTELSNLTGVRAGSPVLPVRKRWDSLDWNRFPDLKNRFFFSVALRRNSTRAISSEPSGVSACRCHFTGFHEHDGRPSCRDAPPAAGLVVPRLPRHSPDPDCLLPGSLPVGGAGWVF